MVIKHLNFTLQKIQQSTNTISSKVKFKCLITIKIHLKFRFINLLLAFDIKVQYRLGVSIHQRYLFVRAVKIICST